MPSIFDFSEQSFWLFVIICLFILFFMVYKIKPISNYFAEAFEDQVKGTNVFREAYALRSLP